MMLFNGFNEFKHCWFAVSCRVAFARKVKETAGI